MRPALAAASLGLLVGLAVTGCSSDSGSSAASPSPSPTPTPAPIVWADGVCVARDGVTAAVGALGRNLSYDISANGTALEQIEKQLRIQVLALGASLDQLGTALKAVPVDFQQANDFVADATKAKDDTTEALKATGANLDAMVNADSIVSGVAAAGKALVSGKAAFEAGSALVTVVKDGATTAGGEVSAAFEAAPACNPVESAAAEQ